jgi:hypothetical protein
MNIKKTFILQIITLWSFTFYACDSPNEPSAASSNLGSGTSDDDEGGDSSGSPQWLIPVNQIYDGGPGKDGIPAITDPETIPVNSASHLDQNEGVVGVRIGDDASAYPHQILDWHEIVNDKAKAYRIKSFDENIQIIEENLAGVPIVTIGSSSHNFAVTYERKPGSNLLTFTAVQDELPVVMIDDQGVKWDIFGRAINGPNKGQELEPMQSYKAFWFAWAAFWPGTDLWSE